MTRYLPASTTSPPDLERATLTTKSYLHIEGGVRDGAVVEALWGCADRPGVIRGERLVWLDSAQVPYAIDYGRGRHKFSLRCGAATVDWVPEPRNLEERISRSAEIGYMQVDHGQVVTTEQLLCRLHKRALWSLENRFARLAGQHPRKSALLAGIAVNARDTPDLWVAIAQIRQTRSIDLEQHLEAHPFLLDRTKVTARVLVNLQTEARQFMECASKGRSLKHRTSHPERRVAIGPALRSWGCMVTNCRDCKRSFNPVEQVACPECGSSNVYFDPSRLDEVVFKRQPYTSWAVEMAQRFPLALAEMVHLDRPVRSSLAQWGFECGQGWQPILERMLERLEAAIQAEPEGQRQGLRISQLKEKFGTLRVYLTTAPTSEMEAAISEAAAASARVCEVCSSPGEVAKYDGWLACRCRAHPVQRRGSRDRQ